MKAIGVRRRGVALDHERESSLVAEDRDRRRAIVGSPLEIEVVDEESGECLDVGSLQIEMVELHETSADVRPLEIAGHTPWWRDKGSRMEWLGLTGTNLPFFDRVDGSISFALMTERALVLAGGGVAGIAWLLGLVDTLRAEGVDITAPDLIIGTSAGACVGAQLATNQLAAAIALQDSDSEIYVDVDLQDFIAKAGELSKGAADEADLMRRFGKAALDAKTVTESERRAVVAARLPSHAWPEQPLRLTAIETASGELVVFDRSSGVSLVDAVTASCAVPLVWPPTTIGAKRYLDGGTRSFSNADLAVGYRRVLIVIPTAPNPILEQKLAAELERLGDVRTLVVKVDAESAATIGPNPLDPSRRKPALDAGRRQGRTVAGDVRTFWT